MDPPPVRKRGRPRKDEQKRRGRKPNPDKAKKLAGELKPPVDVDEDKTKKISDEPKTTGNVEDKTKEDSLELKTADNKKGEKRKKISEEPKTADNAEEKKRRKISEEPKTADNAEENEKKKICEELKVTGSVEEDKREKSSNELTDRGNIEEEDKRNKILEELKPQDSVVEENPKEISPELELQIVDNKEDKTKETLLEVNCAGNRETDNEKKTSVELNTPENKEPDNMKSLFPEWNTVDDRETDEIKKILREFNSVNEGENGHKQVCTMQSPVPEGKASSNMKHCSFDSRIEESQSEQAPVTPEPSTIRMDMKLPECYVLLHRLTDEDIHRSYPSDSDYEISDDVRRKTEELLRQTEEALDVDEEHITYRKNATKRHMRASSKINADVFELYKRKRQGFMNRRNRAPHSDNSLDWSPDEFKAESDSGRGKKKLKRGRKYELDYEWSPNMTKNTVQSTRKLRRHVRRPVIDSDSSSSDEGELLFNMYVNDFNSDKSSDKSAFQNDVPSSGNDTYEHVDTSTLNNSGSDLTVKQNQNSSHISSVNSNSSLYNSDSMSGDIVSNIIRNMNALKGQNIETCFSNKTHQSLLNNSRPKPIQKGRKRVKLSSESKKLGDNIDEQVATLLLDMIKTVSAQVKQLDGSKKKFSKVCKWCSTPFATNKENEVMCAICCDLGKGKFHRTSSNSKKVARPQNTKLPKESKVAKRKNNTMSLVLKNLPKSDMQRLMYAEKTDKMSFGKGYNHCKSFSSPRDNRGNEISKSSYDWNSSVPSNKISIKMNEQKKRSDQYKQQSYNEDGKSHISLKQNQSDRSPLHLMQNRVIKDMPNRNEQLRESGFVLKSVDEGLFQITFPESPKRSDKQEKSQTLQSSEKLSAHNVGRVTGRKSFPELDATKLKSITSEKRHDTYLFPPIPTVIISNYCKDTSGLNLSQTYFQNEITHKHALKNSTSLSQSKGKVDSSKTVSDVKKLMNVTNTMPYQKNSSLPPLLPNNTSLTITTIPINNTINQILPFSNNTAPVLNPLISSAPNKMTIMPVVSSVVSLSDKNLSQPNAAREAMETNSDLFSSNNFINSLNSEIKISHVSSEKTYERMNTELDAEIPIRPEISTTNTKPSENILPAEINSEQNSSSFADVGNRSVLNLNTDELSEQSPNHSLKQLCKPSENKENAISSAMDVLAAVSILAVIDLEKNPHSGLNIRIQVTKGHLAKLTSERNITPELNDRIATCQSNLQVLNMAKRYLSLYGSFAKVSDFLLRKATLIQIKKEILSEESNQSSCMYSQSGNYLSNNGVDDTRASNVSSSPVSNKQENFSSCRVNEQSAAINHIEKLQSQIAAMNNTKVPHYDAGGTIHHFPAEQIASLPTAVAAPTTPVTPRNDCMGGESRETPSRGSGPRTPARPESAASQSEEQSLIQIKKEHLEAASSPPSQCAYSQNNSTLPQISSQLTVMPEMPSLNISEHSISNAIHQIPVSNTNHQLFTNQTNLHLQPLEVAPNRTVYNNNQNYSDVLLNIATKHQVNPPVPSPEIRQNRQVLLGQQMYIQNDSRICAKQPVPSVNNQFVIRPPFSASNTGGTVIVNNSQVGQNALLTNVSNQQFYTSNQVSQLYYPPTSQVTCVPSNTSTPSITATQNQQAEVSPDQMVCAVCKSQATLRCKQCARVAYCNTTCAKTYWHQKHKMECKPLPS